MNVNLKTVKAVTGIGEILFKPLPLAYSKLSNVMDRITEFVDDPMVLSVLSTDDTGGISDRQELEVNRVTLSTAELNAIEALALDAGSTVHYFNLTAAIPIASNTSVNLLDGSDGTVYSSVVNDLNGISQMFDVPGTVEGNRINFSAAPESQSSAVEKIQIGSEVYNLASSVDSNGVILIEQNPAEKGSFRFTTGGIQDILDGSTEKKKSYATVFENIVDNDYTEKFNGRAVREILADQAKNQIIVNVGDSDQFRTEGEHDHIGTFIKDESSLTLFK